MSEKGFEEGTSYCEVAESKLEESVLVIETVDSLKDLRRLIHEKTLSGYSFHSVTVSSRGTLYVFFKTKVKTKITRITG